MFAKTMVSTMNVSATKPPCAHSGITLNVAIDEGCPQEKINSKVLDDSKPGAYTEVTSSHKHLYDTFNVYCCFFLFLSWESPPTQYDPAINELQFFY